MHYRRIVKLTALSDPARMILLKICTWLDPVVAKFHATGCGKRLKISQEVLENVY
jgi:hypothetical protein